MQERNEPNRKKRELANVIFGGKWRKEGTEKWPSIAQKKFFGDGWPEMDVRRQSVDCWDINRYFGSRQERGWNGA